MKNKARIIGHGVYLPEKVLNNEDLEKLVETSDEWICSRTGIKERRIAAENEYTSHMGIYAAKQAIENANISPDAIDFVILATATPDYLCSNTASLAQHGLNLPKVPAIDIQAACTGYLYGLSISKAFIESGMYKNILFIASEKMSSYVDFTDRNTCVLFGDGACATVITGQGKGLAIDHVILGADGEQADLITVPAGGVRIPASHESVDARQHYFKMKGREVFKHAIRRMTGAINDCLSETNLQKSQVNWLVPHQANSRIIEAVAESLEMPLEKVYMTIKKYGNTSASSVGIALAELVEKEEIRKDDHLLLTAFGAGLTWGAAILTQIER